MNINHTINPGLKIAKLSQAKLEKLLIGSLTQELKSFKTYFVYILNLLYPVV